jgi:hypothetical protein
MHMLAISAGQIGPTVFVFLFLLTRLFRCLPTATFLFFLGRRDLTSLAFACLLCAMYGSTGSLVRVLINKYFYVTAMNFSIQKRIPVGWLRQSSFFSVFSLAVLSILGKNLLRDWSFLYSAIGWQCATFASMASESIFSKLQSTCKNKKLLQGLNLIKPLLLGLLVQLSCTLAFFPLNRVSLGSSIVANIIIAPLVSLYIVPLTVSLTLLVNAGLANNSFADLLVYLADIGFTAFKRIAFYCADLSANESDTLSTFRSFSAASRIYLLALLLIGLSLKFILGELELKRKLSALGNV